MKLFIVMVAVVAATAASAQIPPPQALQSQHPLQFQQQPPTEQDILGDIIAGQSKANAKLTIQMIQMKAAIDAANARADIAEAKLKEQTPP